jgi:Cu(I)/Ag(I) efflux system membrane fusion protein
VDGSAKIVFDNYLIIQRALADDSLKKVAASAEALAKAVRENPATTIHAEVAAQADALMKAKDLVAARTALKPLSELLIKYAKANKLTPGAYYEVYCPMAKAGWLQADKAVKNPYFGAAMLRCGSVKN